MVATVLKQAIKYAKNNATKKVSGKDSRKTLNNAKKRGATSVTTKKPTATSVTTPKGGDVSKNNVIKALRKMGTKGKTIAAILAGGAGLLAGSTMMGDKKSLAPEGKTLGPMKPKRRKGPSGPTMTSMSAPSTGPKPRNKDEKVDLKKRGPSRPSMTGFKHGGSVGGTSMGKVRTAKPSNINGIAERGLTRAKHK